MNNVNEVDMFKRTLDRLLELPGTLEVGVTLDMGHKYMAWYPFGRDSKVHMRFILIDGQLHVDTNLMYADYL